MNWKSIRINSKGLLSGILFALALGLTAEAAMISFEDWFTVSLWPGWADLIPIWRCAVLLIAAIGCAAIAWGLGALALWLDQISRHQWSSAAQLLLVMTLATALVWGLECLLSMVDTIAEDQNWSTLDGAAQSKRRWLAFSITGLIAYAAGAIALSRSRRQPDLPTQAGRSAHRDE